MNRPFTRGSVAAALIKMQRRLADRHTDFSNVDRQLMGRLTEEFRVEMSVFQPENVIRDQFSMGMRGQGDVYKSIVGPLDYTYRKTRVYPRSADDMVLDNGSVAP